MNQENNSNENIENINANFLIINEIENMQNQDENEILQYNLINADAIIFPNNILGGKNFFTDNSEQELENYVEVLNLNFNNYLGNEKVMIIEEDVYEFINKNDNLEFFYFFWDSSESFISENIIKYLIQAYICLNIIRYVLK